MALTKEEYDQYILDLKETASPIQKGIVYPETIRNFVNLSDREILEMEAGGHPFKCYLNTAHHKTENCPMFINIHGGGWYIKHLDNDVYYAAWLAEQIGGIVFDIDYSTTEVGPYPVMFAQCAYAVDYAFEHAAQWGVDPSRISIGGYSAGGHLTASMVINDIQKKTDRLALAILCYAPLDMSKKEKPTDPEEIKRSRRGAAFSGLLLGNDESLYEDPTYNPYFASDEILSAFPTTLIITAGKCPFHEQDEAFGARLVSLGVETTMHRCQEASHGFIPHFTKCWEDGADTMVRYILGTRKHTVEQMDLGPDWTV